MDRNCKRIQSQLADYILGTLSDEEMSILNEHIDRCSTCRECRRVLENENRLLVQFGKDLEASMSARQDKVIEVLNRSVPTTRRISLSLWRMIMKNHRTQFAAAAVIFITVLIGIHFLGGSIDGTSIAWADVMEQIKSFRPYAYTQTTRYHHTDNTRVRRFMMLNQYQRREEFPDGTVRIFDHSKEPTGMLQLNPKTKQAAWKISDREAGSINPDILEVIRRFKERPDIYTVEDRGVQKMDGRTTKCFQVPGENYVYTVWVDIETRLPVRIELEHPKRGQTLVMTEFDFEPNFNKTQFDRIPPEGYRFSEYPGEENRASVQSNDFRPRAYTYTTLKSDGSKKVCRMIEPTIDRCRREYDDGQTEIYDYSQDPARCLKLDTEKKQAVLETYPGENRKRINIRLLRIIEDAETKPVLNKVEDRGIQSMDGHSTKCVYIPGMHDTILFTVWKDVDTGLPVRIEQRRPDLTLLFTNFEFDVAFDPNLFEMKAPEGYTLKEVTYPAKVTQPTEDHFIDGLRFLAEFLGGTFPKTLEWPDIQQQIRDYVKENSVDISPDQLKDLRAAIGPFLTYVRRLRSSPKSFDLHYVGDGVHIGDTEKVILWYQPEGKSVYHVVYGDLSVKEVAQENLPK